MQGQCPAPSGAQLPASSVYPILLPASPLCVLLCLLVLLVHSGGSGSWCKALVCLGTFCSCFLDKLGSKCALITSVYSSGWVVQLRDNLLVRFCVMLTGRGSLRDIVLNAKYSSKYRSVSKSLP